MTEPIPRLRLRALVLFYSLLLLVCGAGTLLAYRGPISSDAWQFWSGKQAWLRDILRAAVAAGLAIFALYQMEVTRDARSGFKEVRRLFPVGRIEWAALVMFLCLLAGSILVF